MRILPGTPFYAPVVQRRDNRLRSGPVRVRVLPGAPIHASVAQSLEHRASNAEVEGASPSGNTISSRNVNRTSEPGLFAKEIVPPPCGMRSISSAFRHFHKPANAKASSSRSFKSVLAGASPAVGASFQSSCSPTAETRRRERRQCGCNSRCEHHFRA